MKAKYLVEVIKCATGTYTCFDNENEIWKTYLDRKEWHIKTEECLFADTAIPKIKSKPPFELIQRKREIELQLDIATFAFGVVNICTPQGQLLYSRTFTGERNLLI
ncbi:hypothetical protein FACS1894123_03270 [Bacteroidia bacterium]|nr:hypothetical protein FACS1894123_03270 [Bacteroidia bacterium]